MVYCAVNGAWRSISIKTHNRGLPADLDEHGAVARSPDRGLLPDGRWLAPGLLLVMTVCACRTGGSSAERDAGMSRHDMEFAQALAHYSQGLIYERSDRESAAKALAEFEKALNLDRKSETLHIRVAFSQFGSQQPDAAIKTLEASCKANPKSAQSRMDLAVAYQLMGRTNDAVRQCEKTIRIDPSNPAPYQELVKLYFLTGRDSDALRAIEKGMGNVKPPQIIVSLAYQYGKLFIQSDRIDRAIPCFRFFASRVTAQRSRFFHLLGELFEAVDHRGEALRNYEEAIKEPDPLPETYVRLALLTYETDQARAVSILTDGDKKNPDNPSILSALAFLYSAEQKFEDAVLIYERIIPIVEKSDEHKLTGSFYFQYGAACERSGRFEKAGQIFEKCISDFPEMHEAMNYLAYMWAEKDLRLPKALEYVTTALTFEPDNGAYVDTLGWIYYKMKQYEQALASIRRASEILKDDPTVTDHLGDVFAALNRNDEALECWKKSFTLDPSNATVADKLKAHSVDVESLRKTAAAAAKAAPARSEDSSPRSSLPEAESKP